MRESSWEDGQCEIRGAVERFGGEWRPTMSVSRTLICVARPIALKDASEYILDKISQGKWV